MTRLPTTYTSITLQQRPKKDIDPTFGTSSSTFNLIQANPLRIDELKPNQIVVKVNAVSLDPAMRGWLNDSRSYIPPVKIGEVMRAAAVGRVVKSNDPAFKENDWVTGTLGWQEYAVVSAKEIEKIQVNRDVEPAVYLGALGYPGQTAYWGLLDVGKIKAGETVVISGAGGAVGTVACQIAVLKGCNVIALAGSDSKCEYLKRELGVHEALNYKDPDFKNKFKKIGYLDVYFDNVGEELLNLALTRLKKNARIVLCGAIAAYNNPSPKGVQQYLNLISQRAKIEGFIVFDYLPRFAESSAQLIEWIKSGQLKIKETRLHGIEKCPEGLVGLFRGDNIGKAIVVIEKEEARL